MSNQPEPAAAGAKGIGLFFDLETINVETETMILDDCDDLVATELNGDMSRLA